MLVLKHCDTNIGVVTGEESVLHLPCCGALVLLVLMVMTGSVTQVLVQRVTVVLVKTQMI